MLQATFSLLKLPRLAVLIDAENMSAMCSTELMQLAGERGNLLIRRAYADWTSQHLAGWRKVLEAHVIRPVQQFHYSQGKNASDSALIMDAMELLHERKRRVDAFCIVSSDSDYTGLASRIREAGLAVYGFGRQDAAKSFVAACNAFMFLQAARSPSPAAPWQAGCFR
jgi:DNA-binding LacI/PurR family transcriptional regulator